MSRSSRRTLVSHKLREFNTGNADIDRQLNENLRDHTSHVFEKLRYFDKYTPDHELTKAEADAGVTPVDFTYPPGYINRYGTNTTPGTTDMTAAIQAAFNVALYDGPGSFVYGLSETYRTTGAISTDASLTGCTFFCQKGAIMQCDHNGNGIDWIRTNENFEGNIIEGWTINGPNTFLPAGGYTPPSTGAGINMNRNATTNAVTSYNDTLRDVKVQGFNVGLDMQAVIGLNVFGCFFQYNQYGVKIDGGQTNANHFFGTHIRYNRKRGLSSLGTTGGSLTNATANTFTDCLFESNIPYPFVSGGGYPTEATAIYLNNSYDFVFKGCYSENHACSVYLTNSSKGNRFHDHRTSGGTGREDRIVLDGAGVYANYFDFKGTGGSTSVVDVESNNSDQLHNTFTGEGFTFIPANVTSLTKLNVSDVRPNLNYSPSFGWGMIRMPLHGYTSNINSGTSPGYMSGIGTANATLYTLGQGEIRMGNGITGNTTVKTINDLQPGQIFTLGNVQGTYTVTLSAADLAANSAVYLYGAANVVFNAANQYIMFVVSGSGSAYQIGKNF